MWQRQILWKIFVAQKLGKRTKNGPKQGFSWIYWKIWSINFYWICSIMKICIICCVSVQIPKCSQLIRLQDFLINHISRICSWNSLIFCMLIQIHILVKNGCGQPGHRTPQVIISRINWWSELFFACWCKFRKAISYFVDCWVGIVKNECGH